ncbi:helix-turn-helix domain-containing protein [Paradesulfitobacterium ferrireducens]|uniref:helix-turn-helix domain-containing protein n=1 Tax=Paradesulfitobacterium ferrireducens TaxID=2816476 RepID=UPI001A8D8C45|nr:helix-turn-helix domain-containing protein [Paradesulfitobacterium ferrireducens]
MEIKDAIDNRSIGQRIRQERDKLKLSREEFAEILGLSEYYIGQLERGERQMSLPVLVRVSHCLHLSLDYLILGKNVASPSYLNDSLNNYDTCDTPDITGISDSSAIINTSISDEESKRIINELINKCSSKELDLIRKLIITILPYM